MTEVAEAVGVVRTFLDEGAITRDGEFFSYDGLFTFARPVQDHLPVKMGAMRGPKSFEVAAEFSDGCHHALSYNREAYEYMMEHCTIGAERAGIGMGLVSDGRIIRGAESAADRPTGPAPQARPAGRGTPAPGRRPARRWSGRSGCPCRALA